MTTYFPFTPTRHAVPTFAPTLDGEQYSCTCTWNLFGQRYYLNCFDLEGNRVFSRPIVDSPPAVPLNALSWAALPKAVTATTQAPHGYPIGAVVALTITGASPAAFNGAFSCRVTGPKTFTYPLADDPGACVLPGAYSAPINLAAGYFKASTIIYRNRAFEVSP